VNTQKFDTNGVISLLKLYVPVDTDDAKHKEETLAFVTSHPDFYKRALLIGHTTASAWVVDETRQHILLTHHANLDRWMQLGGHIEEIDPDIHAAALREASEESGLTDLTLYSPNVFDIDIHKIPTSSKAPEHLHYDIRFLIVADPNQTLSISSESKSLKWCTVEEVKQKSNERSVRRMLEKSLIVPWIG